MAESTLIFLPCNSCGLKLTGSSMRRSWPAVGGYDSGYVAGRADPVLVAPRPPEAAVLGHVVCTLSNTKFAFPICSYKRKKHIFGEPKLDDFWTVSLQVLGHAEHRLLGKTL